MLVDVEDLGSQVARCIGGGKNDPGGCGQVIDPDLGDPAQVQAVEAEWKVPVAQAQQAAAGRGPLPGGLGRSVEQVLHPSDAVSRRHNTGCRCCRSDIDYLYLAAAEPAFCTSCR